jgi:DNA-binding NarL/FixJ family response regulator
MRLGSDPVAVIVGRFDPLLGYGLAAVLREDRKVEVIACDVQASRLQYTVAQSAPRVVVVLDELAEQTEAVKLRADCPEVGLVVLAREPPLHYGMLLLAAGMTCLPWSASAEAILRAVHLTAQGGCAFVSSESETVEHPDRRKGRILTQRQLQVLGHVSEGRSPAEIALALELSIETVRRHITHLRRKLKVPSTRSLVGIQIPPALQLS